MHRRIAPLFLAVLIALPVVVPASAAEPSASASSEPTEGPVATSEPAPTPSVDPTASPDTQLDQSRLRDAWVDSLAVAGRSGTLAHRMRRTAAQGKCHAKTGTLTGVSALSGYCFRGADDAEHAIVFSLLMNRVDVNRARLVQDRMAALIARYRR